MEIFATDGDRKKLRKGQNLLHQFPCSKSVTSWQVRLYMATWCVMDFGRKAAHELDRSCSLLKIKCKTLFSLVCPLLS